jgi:hypothetical protein
MVIMLVYRSQSVDKAVPNHQQKCRGFEGAVPAYRLGWQHAGTIAREEVRLGVVGLPFAYHCKALSKLHRLGSQGGRACAR